MLFILVSHHNFQFIRSKSKKPREDKQKLILSFTFINSSFFLFYYYVIAFFLVVAVVVVVFDVVVVVFVIFVNIHRMKY